MRAVEKAGRTVEEAVAEALRELGVSRDQVDVTVLDEGSKGFFGLLGTKLARVRVQVRDPLREKEQAALSFLDELLRRMSVEAAVESRRGGENEIYVNVTGQELGIIIGRHGQTLEALQLLAAVVANRQQGPWAKVVLDVEGYRARREEQLRTLARRAAERVKAERRRVVLAPMSPPDRRIVHLELAGDEEVETHSEGEDPYRRVVIVPRWRGGQARYRSRQA